MYVYLCITINFYTDLLRLCCFNICKVFGKLELYIFNSQRWICIALSPTSKLHRKTKIRHRHKFTVIEMVKWSFYLIQFVAKKKNISYMYTIYFYKLGWRTFCGLLGVNGSNKLSGYGYISFYIIKCIYVSMQQSLHWFLLEYNSAIL